MHCWLHLAVSKELFMALKGINAYKKGNLKQDISTADPHKITLMLMQGALDRMAYAKGCIERKDFEGKSEHLSRASAIVMNLRDTLDMEVKSEIEKKKKRLKKKHRKKKKKIKKKKKKKRKKEENKKKKE
eukprot:TRINITY_DN90063_c1_g1_i2.p1 TRINITY_DN90063_c1_g1~~TRINITY_DN90063_c1_g1_i2.p1  ORF type:complete len:130 (-),score=20.31 TRINITY_DN90063_c1_g1_i2:57-446(-)